MCGIESEAETFMKMRPKFFFINCEVIMGIDQDVCPSLCANIFFPVILKGGGTTTSLLGRTALLFIVYLIQRICSSHSKGQRFWHISWVGTIVVMENVYRFIWTTTASEKHTAFQVSWMVSNTLVPVNDGKIARSQLSTNSWCSHWWTHLLCRLTASHQFKLWTLVVSTILLISSFLVINKINKQRYIFFRPRGVQHMKWFSTDEVNSVQQNLWDLAPTCQNTNHIGPPYLV